MYTTSHLAQHPQQHDSDYVCSNNSSCTKLSMFAFKDHQLSKRQCHDPLTLVALSSCTSSFDIQIFIYFHKNCAFDTPFRYGQMCQQFFKQLALPSRTTKVLLHLVLFLVLLPWDEEEKSSQLENGKLNCCHSNLSKNIQFMSWNKKKSDVKQKFGIVKYIQFTIMSDWDKKAEKWTGSGWITSK